MDEDTIKWRIYYDNGSTFDNTQGKPWEAPGRGVVCIVQIDPSPRNKSVNTQVLVGHAYYWFHVEWGYWLHSDIYGIIDLLTNDRDRSVCAVKMGRWLDYLVFEDIMERAYHDPDFPKKSGASKVERRYTN
jgi:hypothetical protein